MKYRNLDERIAALVEAAESACQWMEDSTEGSDQWERGKELRKAIRDVTD